MKVKEAERWIPTSCNACFNVCAIRVKEKDGRIIDIKGDNRISSSRGKICGKSKARITDLYNPRRVTQPLKRTNPEKGIGVDPRWQKISWDEALETISEKLAEIRKRDPRELIISTFDICNAIPFAQSFGIAFGTPNYEFYPVSCGNGLHSVFFVTLGTLNAEIDLKRCNYILLCGSQLGHGVNNNPLEAIRHMAEARKRGARLVVIDPICGQAAAKADEWIPIRPGTDGALALGMANVMINDLGLYDRKYLEERTNAPYLVDEKGRYVRDAESSKPLVWDLNQNADVAYDEECGHPAIEGRFKVNDVSCRPIFDLLKNHLQKDYPLEKVESITTVPKETIFRIAKEFAEAARIDAEIEINGQVLPFRPAAIEFKRGITHHKNGFFNCFSLQLLNILIGNINMPGGLLGTNPKGPLGIWDTFAGKDGMVETDLYYKATGGRGSFASFMAPFPPKPVSPPESLNLKQLFPVSGFLPGTASFPISDPEKFKIPYKPSMMISCRENLLVSNSDPQFQSEMLRRIDFIVSFALKIDETAEFADIILPEAHDFEKHWFFPVNHGGGFQCPGEGEWYFQTIQPVVEPPVGVRNWVDVLSELAERGGFLSELNSELNGVLMFGDSGELSLKPDTKYSMKEIHDRSVALFAGICGQEAGPELLTDELPCIKGPVKKTEEAYAGPYIDARVPLYFEYFLEEGEKVRAVTREIGMDWWDTSHYDPLVKWRPCPAFEEDGKEYDLFVVSSRLPLHSQSPSADNPWIDDICKRSRLDYNILLNEETAARKGIMDGDLVWVESRTGRVKGKVRVTGAVHNETVGILGGHLGQWAKEKVIARGKGVHINSLVAHDWSMVGTLTGQLDTCARVKIYKAGS